jgi:hypothetical protein
VIGPGDGKVQSGAFEGRVLSRRFENPPGKSTLEIPENSRAALEARDRVVDWLCASRQDCGNQADGGWRRRNGMNLGIGSDVRCLTGTLTFEGATVHVLVGVETKNFYVRVL